MTLFLDLDNTILPTKICYEATIPALAKDWSLKGFGTENDFFSLYESARKSTKEQLVGSPSNRLRILYFKKMIEALHHGKLSPTEFETLFWLESRYNYHFTFFLREERTNRSEWDEIFILLKKISMHFPICFLTNENLRTQAMKIKEFFPSDFSFSFVCSEEVGFEKPAKEYFSYAFKKMNASPDSCIMIGDNWEDDIVGSSRSGIASIWIREMFGVSGIVTERPTENGSLLFETDRVLSALDFAFQWLGKR